LYALESSRLFTLFVLSALYQGNFSINSAPNSLKEALDQYDIQRAKTKFGFPKDRAAAAKSEAGVAATSNIPASAIKQAAGTPSVNNSKPKAPVPSFHGNAASANAHVTKTAKPLITQTPSVSNPRASHQTPSVPNAASAAKPVVTAERSVKPPGPQQQQAPPFASRERPQPPFASRGQPPPPTSTQGLQSSSLFKLQQYAAGNNTAVVQSEAKPAHDENIPPIDFDALDRERPNTSMGREGPGVGALSGAKRPLEATAESQSSQARKASNLNPYRASL
jgi:hypothetical protein